MDQSIIQAITFAIALLGAILGVMNTWRTLDRDRVKLRIKPMIAAIGNNSLRLAVEVRNMSQFDLTIASFGFVRRGESVEEAFFVQSLNGDEPPITLKPRTSYTGIVRPGVEQRDRLELVCAVRVHTECGHIETAKSAALAWYVVNRPPVGIPLDITAYRQRQHGVVVVSPHGVPKGYTGPLPK